MPDIPDEAIEAFVEAFRRSGAWGSECVRAGLAAALPHLAPPIRAQVSAEAEAVFPTSTAALDAFMARWQMGHGAGAGTVSVSLLADVRKALGAEPTGATRPADPDTP